MADDPLPPVPTFEELLGHLDDWIALAAEAGFTDMAAPARALKARYVAYRPFYEARDPLRLGRGPEPDRRLAVFDPNAQRDGPEGE